jgi:hypothetical protein
MSDIKTWHERCMAHPDHQNGMVSDEMIRARMCEEIEELRARVTVLERVREAALPHLFTPSMETGIALLKAVQEAKP